MRTFLITSLFALSNCLTAKKYDSDADLSNELKVNLGMGIADIPELTYERIVSRQSSVGLSLAIDVGKFYDDDYMITPYYRFSGKKKGSRFFRRSEYRNFFAKPQ